MRRADPQRLDDQRHGQVSRDCGNRTAAGQRTLGHGIAKLREAELPEPLPRARSVGFAHQADLAPSQCSNTSSMRLEKPHSLSYQAITLTSSPCTRVWLRSATQDAG